MSFVKSGYDTRRHSPLRAINPLKWPVGQRMMAGRDVASCGLFGDAEIPAGCGADAVQVPLVPLTQVPGGGDWSLAKRAKYALKSVPDEAVVSLETIVLLVKFTARESSSPTPPPSQPATLLTMMLLVTLTEYQFCGVSGNRVTSVPFTAWKRIPPPEPLSAALPRIRLESMVRPGPDPSLSPGTQSSSFTLPHSTATPF